MWCECSGLAGSRLSADIKIQLMAACGRGEAAPGLISRAAIEDISAQITNFIYNLQLMQFMQGLYLRWDHHQVCTVEASSLGSAPRVRCFAAMSRKKRVHAARGPGPGQLRGPGLQTFFSIAIK